MIICVTGKMAAGKNYICSQYEKQGWLSFDADIAVHNAIEEEKSKIIETFEALAIKKNIFIKNSDSSINRKELGKLLFSNKELLKKQENIVYPYVCKKTHEFIELNEGKNIIINATLLFKTPELLSLCDHVVFVKANFFKRLMRARKRDSLSFMQIIKRFYAQRNLFSQYKKTKIKIECLRN